MASRKPLNIAPSEIIASLIQKTGVIARPPAAAGKQFGLRAEVIVIAVARPVAMAIISFALAFCFTSL